MLNRIKRLHFPSWTIPLALLAVTVASYGLMINQLGFYWDDWPFAWITHTFGNAGLTRYFATNRPVWGLFYKLTTPFLGQNPLVWQIFGLTWRWLSAVALWWALGKLWPARKAQMAWVALLFVVYPGFGQQFIALTYGHFFLILTLFFLSLGLMLWALRSKARYWPLTGFSLLTSAANLFAMEYFFGLDLLRPLLIWLALGEQELAPRRRLAETARRWAPFFALDCVYAFWRAFIFKFQTYQPSLVSSLSANPLRALAGLLSTVGQDVATTSVGAWLRAFQPPALADFGARSTQVYWALVAVCFLGLAVYLFLLRGGDGPRARLTRWPLPLILTGLLALLACGLPFWLTGLQVGLTYPNDRFTLPFILGASLLLAGLIELIPGPRVVKIALLSLAVALGIGVQYQNATDYRRDWNRQRRLLWQLVWRAPAIQPGTTLLSAEVAFMKDSDNSLTAPINWIYAPEDKSLSLPYLFAYPTVRSADLPATPQAGAPIHNNYLAATFNGSTSQMIVLNYGPPACLRLLDPVYDAGIPLLPADVQEWQPLSRPDLVLPEGGQSLQVITQLLGPEPEHDWCYYFEKADLARQQGDWAEVARLGDIAFGLSDYPNEPSERLPFVEGYAHVGRWQAAEDLSRQTLKITALMKPMLCATWQRIAQTTTPDAAQQGAVSQMEGEFQCTTP